MNSYGIVYCAQNIVNDKFYIGQTVQTLEKRRKNHESTVLNKKHYFHNALQKYGFNKFNWSILYYAQDKESLNAAEIYWIKNLNSRNKEKGYNLRSGGANGKHLEESKKKISKSRKGKPSNFKGKTHSKESKRKNSESHKGIIPSEESKRKNSESHKGENNGFYGKTHSKETKKKNSESHMGKPSGMKGKIPSNKGKKFKNGHYV